MQKFKQKVQARKNAFSGEIVKQQLCNAYESGINDLASELKNRFEVESKKDPMTIAGLQVAIKILLEYGS